jgi:hypothetical protein
MRFLRRDQGVIGAMEGDGDGESDPLPRTYPIDEVLERLGSPIKNQSVIAEIGNTEGPWYDLFEDRHGYISRHENWNGFCGRIMYRSRFFFYRPVEGDANEFEPTQWPSVEVLDDVADLIRDARLVRTVCIGHRFFRARQHHPERPVLKPGAARSAERRTISLWPDESGWYCDVLRRRRSRDSTARGLG